MADIAHDELIDQEPNDCECCPWAVTHGYRLGAAVAFGVIGMAFAIREKLWQCDYCHRPDDPNACCRGQNFVPADPDGPWICWVCGVDDNMVAEDRGARIVQEALAVPSPSNGEKT